MNALENAVQRAILSEGATIDANKAYLEFLKANFMIPIEKNLRDGEPVVLYLNENAETFLPVFTNETHLNQWADEIRDEIQILKLSGVDLLKGIGENVSVSLNPGSSLHKTFNPMELKRLKSMVLKLFKNQ
jgi:hypothetical protein